MNDHMKHVSDRITDKMREIPYHVEKANRLLSKAFSHIKWRKLLPHWSSNTLRFIVFLQLLIIVAGGGFGGWQYYTYLQSLKGETKREIPKSIVEVTPVEQGIFETFTTTVGSLKANESIIIRPEIDGKVKEILFDTGDRVSKGDILFRLEEATYAAHLREAKAKVDMWKSKAARSAILYEKKAGTLKDKEEAAAQLEISKAELDRAHHNFSKAVIKAPFDGLIGFRDIGVGAYVKPGEDLVTLDDLDTIKVEFRLGENMIDKIKIGDKVTLEIDGFPDSVYEASINAIDTNVDAAAHSVRVRALLDNKEDLFKPGLFAKVKVMLSSHGDVLLVPEAAVESRGSQEFVYIVVDGIAKRMSVKTGGRNGEKVEILAGLEPGQKVVIAGQIKVQDGFPVIPVPPNALKRF